VCPMLLSDRPPPPLPATTNPAANPRPARARTGDKLSYQKCKWKRLGYLSLDNNERSSWQARELKSVQVLPTSLSISVSVSVSIFNSNKQYMSVSISITLAPSPFSLSFS
jgi:hypothetical protein